jgi:hypothetical protein
VAVAAIGAQVKTPQVAMKGSDSLNVVLEDSRLAEAIDENTKINIIV